MKKILTSRFILNLIFVSISVLIGCDKQSEVLSPVVELDKGLAYRFPFDGNSNDVVNNINYDILNASYSDDRFGDSKKALKLGCKCGLSQGLNNVGLGLGESEGAVSIWLNFDDLQKLQPIFFKGYYADAHPYYYSIYAGKDGSLAFFWTGLNLDDETQFIPNVFNSKQWYHLLIRWSNDKGLIEVFVSGNKVMSEPYNGFGDILDDPEYVAFSPNKVSEDNYYRGKIDDLRKYDRWLNDDEVSTLFQ